MIKVDLIALGFHWEVDPEDNRGQRFTNDDIALAWIRHGFDVDKGQYSYKVGDHYSNATGECFLTTLEEAKGRAEPMVRLYILQREIAFTKAYTFLKRINLEPDLHRLAVNY